MKSRLAMPATTLKVSVRPEPTRPNTPVIWPANTDSELFFTIAAMRRFCTDSTRLPCGRTLVLRWPYSVCERSRPTIACTMRARSKLRVSSVTTCLPSRRTVMRSDTCSASSSACEMKITDTPRRLRLAMQVEEVLLLFRRQARGRLVEDDDLGVVQHRARDLDHLLLRGTELADDGGGVDVELQRLHELLRGDVDAAQAVEEALAPEVEVLRHRHRRHQAGFLEHHRDAELARLGGRACVDAAALDRASRRT